MIEQTTIALLSGGIDSVTAACLAMEAGQKVIGLSFDYGQRHLKELKAAADLAKDLNLEDHITIKIDLSSWGGSSLTDTSKICTHWLRMRLSAIFVRIQRTERVT